MAVKRRQSLVDFLGRGTLSFETSRRVGRRLQNVTSRFPERLSDVAIGATALYRKPSCGANRAKDALRARLDSAGRHAP